MPKSSQNKVRPKSTKRSKKKQPKLRKGEKRSKELKRGRKSRKIKKGKQRKKYRKMKGGADFGHLQAVNAKLRGADAGKLGKLGEQEDMDEAMMRDMDAFAPMTEAEVYERRIRYEKTVAEEKNRYFKPYGTKDYFYLIVRQDEFNIKKLSYGLQLYDFIPGMAGVTHLNVTAHYPKYIVGKYDGFHYKQLEKLRYHLFAVAHTFYINKVVIPSIETFDVSSGELNTIEIKSKPSTQGKKGSEVKIIDFLYFQKITCKEIPVVEGTKPKHSQVQGTDIPPEVQYDYKPGKIIMVDCSKFKGTIKGTQVKKRISKLPEVEKREIIEDILTQLITTQKFN